MIQSSHFARARTNTSISPTFGERNMGTICFRRTASSLAFPVPNKHSMYNLYSQLALGMILCSVRKKCGNYLLPENRLQVHKSIFSGFPTNKPLDKLKSYLM
mmetsp:Transcript_12653/g.20091  ORF Transcript_12653/g.20091 Transcript_12653/m.20091 type:complete len:102 (+) Transcript_12653:301-606(+)